MEFRKSHNILITTAEFGKSLKLTKNGKIQEKMTLIQS